MCKLEKYMLFTISDSAIKDKIKYMHIEEIDFSLDANIFYGLKEGDKLYRQIEVQDFDNYDVILRLLNWSRQCHREDYSFRVLKSNKKENVDFQEESSVIKSSV